jgi:hypothetical protein
MTHKEDRPAPEWLRTRFVEALLSVEVDPSKANSEARIQRVLDAVAAASRNTAEISSTRLPVERPTLARRRILTRLGAIATAAVLLIGLFMTWQLFGQAAAQATVIRSLRAAQDTATRKYQLSVTRRGADGDSLTVDNELYVQGRRFCMRHPGLIRGTSLWIGDNERETWVIPAIGPIRVGDELGLSRWLHRETELDTPYLHVTSLLKRMSQGYRLEALPEESIPIGGLEYLCDRVRGTLQHSSSTLPDSIELYADTMSGLAVRLVATWNHDTDKWRRERIEISLVEPNEKVGEDWFDYQAHASDRRMIIQFNADPESDGPE